MTFRFEQKKIVNETTHTVYNPKNENDIKKLCYDMNDLVRDLEFENTNLQERNNRQKETIQKQQDMIDNYIDIKAKLNAKITELEKENEQLKKQKARYKRLSEIRNEEINNRILTIKEFIDNCSNEKVKKALEDLFYSEVNEYDLSKKYRKLHEENEDLKEDNAILKQALTRLVESFNDHISDNSPVRDLIK